MATERPPYDPDKYRALRREVFELRKKVEELSGKLARESTRRGDAEDTLKRWQAELEILASKRDHDLCHVLVPTLLKNTIGLNSNFPNPLTITREEFKTGCRIYQHDLFGPDTASIYTGPGFRKKAVFFDRDGTLIKAIHRPDFEKKLTAPFTMDELEFVPDAYQLLDKLREVKFELVMVTNQPDVRHGYMDEKVWERIQQKVIDTLSIKREYVYMCRHRQEDNCHLKKPCSDMLTSAADNLGIDLPKSWMVGDSEKDVQAGKLAGCRTILISQDEEGSVSRFADYRVKSLVEAVDIILNAQG